MPDLRCRYPASKEVSGTYLMMSGQWRLLLEHRDHGYLYVTTVIIGAAIIATYTIRMDALASIKVFWHVEGGSFVSAAERMDLSTAMVSKHVMHIEKRLGLRLLNRNSHALGLREPGRVYFERCKTILDDLEETELERGSLSSAPRSAFVDFMVEWSSTISVATVEVSR
jgi:Bacterial regulatory helix-turn-helix protein, lysR family